MLLDWLGGKRARRPAADRLIALGLLFTAPAAATGLTEWADSEAADDDGAPRRDRARRAQHRRARRCSAPRSPPASAARAAPGRRSRWPGAGAAGRLRPPRRPPLLRRGRRRRPDGVRGRPGGVDRRAARERAPRGRVRATPRSAASASWWRATRARSTRSPTAARTAAARSTRASSPTAASPARCTARVFKLDDGSVVQGPSAYPQPSWEVRVRDGVIELKPPA